MTRGKVYPTSFILPPEIHDRDIEIKTCKMVYLTMTSTIVEALEMIQTLEGVADEKSELHDATKSGFEDGDDGSAVEARAGNKEKSGQSGCGRKEALEENTQKKEESTMGNHAAEPSLSNPKPGNPISHGQIIDLSRKSKAHGLSPRSLDILLRGARIYVAPPPPKPETVSSTNLSLSQRDNSS
jgi:hypothetical protein